MAVDICLLCAIKDRVIRAYAAHLPASEASLKALAEYEESCGSGSKCGGESQDVIEALRVARDVADDACEVTKSELDHTLAELERLK